MTGAIFLRETAGDDHEIGLARGWAEDFGAETREVKTRGGHGHHLDGAAGQAKNKRPKWNSLRAQFKPCRES